MNRRQLQQNKGVKKFAPYFLWTGFFLAGLSGTAAAQLASLPVPTPVNPAQTNPLTGQALSKAAPPAVAPTPSLTLSAEQTARLQHLFKDDQSDTTATAALQNVLPNSPAQIAALKQRYADTTLAAQPDPIAENTLKNTVRTVNLMRSPTPPLLHLVLNYATNISFAGQNGKPWPITAVVPGNKEAIEVDESVKKNPYNSTVTVKMPWVSTNIAYYLQGRVKPIVLFIHTSADTHQGLDSSVNLVLEGLAPGSSPLPVKNVGVVSDALLNAVNTAPGSMWQRVSVDGDNLPLGLQMWTSPDKRHAIVRVSGGQLLSPEWASEVSNPDNTVTAYAFDQVPLMLLANTAEGQSFQIRLKQAVQTLAGEEKPDNEGDSVKDISAIEQAAMQRISHAEER